MSPIAQPDDYALDHNLTNDQCKNCPAWIVRDSDGVWRHRATDKVDCAGPKRRYGTKGRNIRIDDELWNAAQKRAKEREEDVSEAIRKFLVRYTK